MQFAGQDGGEALKHSMRRFANRNHSKIGNTTKIVFRIAAAQDMVRATDAARYGRSHVQRLQRSQKNSPGKLLSVHHSSAQTRN
jgi:hypothetical protein